MQEYKMNIRDKYLNSIREHKKRHEYRLNNEERQKMNINDFILLTSNEVPSNQIKVVITKKTIFPNWQVAILKNWREDFSDSSRPFNEVLKELKTYYSDADVKKYGIVMFDIGIVK